MLDAVAALDVPTLISVSKVTGIDRKIVTSLLCRLSREGASQMVRIVDYESEGEEGERPYPRPVYAIGFGPPLVPRPEPIPKRELQRRYWKQATMRTVASVFDLAVPTRVRMKLRKVRSPHADLSGASKAG